MRILTVLLLPLLFFTTSCDSGGEGTACGINPVGIWEFTQFDLDFSDCNCGADDCNDVLETSLLDEVSCLSVSLAGGNLVVNLEVCDPECITPGRTLDDCYFSTSYSCSDKLISSGGDVWEVNGNIATTIREQSVDDFEASISIVGSKGLAQIGGIAVNELQIFTPDLDACTKYSEDFSDCVYGDGHKLLYKDIYHSISSGASYPVSQHDCLQTIRLLHAFYRSDEKNGWQQVDEDGESIRLGQENNEISNLYRTIK